MNVKYTHQFLTRLEELMSESDYILRYEKGNFQSGYCLLKDTKIAIVNKYFPLDGKINSIIEIIRSIDINVAKLSEKNRKLLADIQQNQLQF